MLRMPNSAENGAGTIGTKARLKPEVLYSQKTLSKTNRRKSTVRSMSNLAVKAMLKLLQ